MFSCSDSCLCEKKLTVSLLADVLTITEIGNYCLAFLLMSTNYLLGEEVMQIICNCYVVKNSNNVFEYNCSVVSVGGKDPDF